MKNLQAFIDGTVSLNKNQHTDIGSHFKDRGYKQITPYKQEDAPRGLLRTFYEEDNMFSLTDHTLKQLWTVYKVDNKFEVQFAASFFVVKLDRQLFAYLDVIKARVPRQGHGTKFIADLVQFLEGCLEANKSVTTAHFILGQSQLLEPHEFFKKQGFGALPDQFKHLKHGGCDLAYRGVPRIIEEEKGQRNQEDEDIDDGKSDVSALTNKTSKSIKSRSGRALDKHCSVCDKRISGTNWTKHVSFVHKDLTPLFTLYSKDNNQIQGLDQSSVAGQPKKSSHKMGNCLNCGKEGQARRLTEGFCAMCSKRKAMTVINAPISKLLTAGVLGQLPKKQDIEPNDILSVVGDKRWHDLMEDEPYDSPQDVPNEESEEFKHSFPQKRQKIDVGQTLNDTKKPHQTIGNSVLIVAHTDAEAIQQLKEIERSSLHQAAQVLKLQDLCMMFPQESVFNFLRDGKYPKIESLLPLVLARANQLSTEQRAGLLFGCLIFNGVCWNNAIEALNGMSQEERLNSLGLLKSFAARLHGSDVAQWFFDNWSHIESWHFSLLEHLRIKPLINKTKVLMFSLCVTATGISLFVDYTNSFGRTPCSSLIIDNLQVKRKQPKLQFNDFMLLTDALMQDNNAFVVSKCKDELLGTPLADWVELLERTASTVHLSDKNSVQEAINEFIQAYGQIDQTFSTDLFLPGSPLGLIMRETQNKPNFKQLGLSHYCIGGLQKVERQLWCVPSGDGKSRISAFSCLTGIKTGMFQKVYLVFDNEHLMERDKADFEDLWRLAECQDKIEYHVGYDFEPEENSLILIDESDRVMFEQPKSFADFIDKKFCICFTATPSNCDQQGVEAEVIKALGFKQYDYVVGQVPLNLAARLQFDELNNASTLEQKVETVSSLLKQGSVLVYGPQDLLETLQASFGEFILIDETINSAVLRQLDKAPYKLLGAPNSFGMRGIDYRSKSNPMYLVVAQQFPCVREALQGVARVGRFGDPCRRIKFAECQELVNQRSQVEHNAKLLSFIGEVKARVQVKAAETKKSSPKKPQPAQGSRMAQARARGLLAQPLVGQKSLIGFFKSQPM